MKNLNLKEGKSLSREELRTINGGVYTTRFSCEQNGGTWNYSFGAWNCVLGPKPKDKVK